MIVINEFDCNTEFNKNNGNFKNVSKFAIKIDKLCYFVYFNVELISW